MTTDPERAAARLAAFGLVEAVQVRDVGVTLAAAQADAIERDWPDVQLVLLYAQVVRGFVADDPSVGEAISRLHDAADRAGDQAMLSVALASRAAHDLSSDVAPVRQGADHDLARATALLEFASGAGALERATAYVACAVGYSVRELWELEEELYAAVTPVLAECEVPLLEAVVAFNRAEASVRLLCALREVDHTDELRRLAPRAQAVVDSALVTPMPAAWAAEAAVFGHLLCALTAGHTAEPTAALERRVVPERGRCDAVEGQLRLADALCAAHDGSWAEVAAHTERALALSPSEFSSSARALALRLAAQAEAHQQGPARAVLALRYADYGARRRWDARVQMVGSARSSMQTEHLRIERDLHARDAMVDELTGLANRRGYSRHVQRLRRRHQDRQVAVLLVDIDNFKAINDNHGHAAGDGVLARVARTLDSETRPDDLIARLGGDELVALLDDLDVDAAHRRALGLLERLDEVPWGTLSPGLQVAVSVGVAAGRCGDDPETLVRRADTALYRAKAGGGCRVEVAPADGSWSGARLRVVQPATSPVRRLGRPRP